jgi:glutaredoxin
MKSKICILLFTLILFSASCLSFAAENAEAAGKGDKAVKGASFTLYLFEGAGCPHCADEKKFLESIGGKYRGMRVKEFEVWHNRDNAVLFAAMSNAYGLTPRGVPVTFIGSKSFIGFSPQIGQEILATIEQCSRSNCPDPLNVMSGMQKAAPAAEKAPAQAAAAAAKKTDQAQSPAETVKPEAQPAAAEKVKPEETKDITIDLPIVGPVKGDSMSLPALTVVIAGLDSFNPCAFFVLFSLLGILIHAHSRSKLMLIGGIFVFFSGLIYFIFMAAWLNMFLLLGHVAMLTTIAGIVSVIIAAINIKDFFWFKEGVSLTMTDTAQSKLFDRMRKLLKTSSMPSIILGTVVLAVAANSYELLCTAGFPMVYTRILTLNNLSTQAYYLYLVLYNVIYVIPLAAIVIALGITLGRRALTEWEGRVLKLVSGFMMLGLGITLVFAPALLNNMLISMLILTASVGISTIIALLFRKKEKTKKK